MCAGLELEHEVCDVNEKKEGGSSTGNKEKTRSVALLGGTRLTGLQENIIVDALGRDIGSRNDKRFYGASKLSKNPERPDKLLTDARERHEGGSVLRHSDLEVTLRILQTTGQEGTSQNEEQVGENGAEQLCNVVG